MSRNIHYWTLEGESALKAAKKATKGKTDRYLGRTRSEDGRDGFDVFENGKIVERHTVIYSSGPGMRSVSAEH